MPSFNFWEDGAQNYLHYALILVIVEINSPQRLPLRRKKELRKKLGILDCGGVGKETGSLA